MTNKGIKANDLLQFSFLSDPQLSPDGNWAIFVHRTINEKKKYQSSLYLKNLATKETIRFTQGDTNDLHPRWSPDGRSIAFTSNRSGKQQVWSISLNGGEAKQLTDFKNGASKPIWAPNSKQLLLTVSLANNESIVDEVVEDSNIDSDDLKPYVTTRLKYKSDAEGFSKDMFSQFVLLELKTGNITQLTDGEFDHHDGVFSPDGSHIAFSSNQTSDPDRTLISDIYQLQLSNQELTKLTSINGMFDSPNYSPDGKQLSILGHDMAFTGATLTRVWVLDLLSKQLTCLTEEWDVQASDVAINDMGTGTKSSGAVWSTNANSLYFQASESGNTHLYQVTLDKKISTLLDGTRQIYAFSFDKKQEKILIAISDNLTPGDLYLVNKENKEEQQLTKANEDWLDDKTIAINEDFHFSASDGVSLHGWIMKPSGYQEGIKYPLVVEIHGGPHAMYSNAFMHEFQVLTEKGYGVLFINPRGSHGYGQSFVDAVRGDYGGKDYTDIMDAVDYAVNTFNWIDQERLGVTGGSYGGFMTNWIVGHTNKFKAAVTQRSISNWISFSGVSDIGYFFTEWELKTTLFENPDKLWQHSPLRYVKNVETPLLILHSERDFRCPIEQAEQFYVALKQQNKITRFVRFPESNHELSRNGDPTLRINRLNEITDWFDRYL